ncbi:hypothetical protein O3P69_018002 [Scylla paramamosain]|uniref:Uncharacterized protein n=1 Tax=Scylla paramamosain TaxID=85552 RepID=A0AAW0TH54_SCYPA
MWKFRSPTIITWEHSRTLEQSVEFLRQEVSAGLAWSVPTLLPCTRKATSDIVADSRAHTKCYKVVNELKRVDKPCS